MKHPIILVPVKCSEETNPKESKFYLTNYGHLYFCVGNKRWYRNDEYVYIRQPVEWYKTETDKYVLSEEELKNIWDEACEAQQQLIIDTILSKGEATEKQSDEDIKTLKMFAKVWNDRKAPKPVFKPTDK